MLNFKNITNDDVKNIDSFKKCIDKLVKKTGYNTLSYNIDIELKGYIITFCICHKKSPIPQNIGEIKLTNNRYKIVEY